MSRSGRTGRSHDVPETDTDRRWLRWWTLYSAEPQLRRRGGRAGLGTRPPLPEQRRIAEVLDAVDGAIRTTEAVVAKLEKVEVGVRQDIAAASAGGDAPLRAILAACADRIWTEAAVLRKLRSLQQGLVADLMGR